MIEKHEALVKLAASPPSGMLETALTLAEAGLPFFPCAADKSPRVTGWPKLDAVDAAQARAWHKQWPDMMLGLPTGSTGVFVVDLDKAKRPGDPDGLEEFQSLCGRHGHDFQNTTLCARTGSGGMHVFYKMPPDRELRNTVRKLGAAIDTRGHGGYVIIAPSSGERGRYEWANSKPIAKLPDWLLDLLTKDKPEQPAAPLAKTPQVASAGYVNERERKAYQAALDKECAKVAAAAEGTRNAILNVASYNLGRYVGAGKLDEAEVYDALHEAALKSGLATGEIAKTFSSGLKKGILKPKTLDPHGGSWEQGKNALTSEARGPGEAVREETGELDKYLDEVNANRLIAGFLDAAQEFAQSSAISTGFANLDAMLDGGLYPGLYVLGAISSLGKTTFALQMADAIARAGRDVLIFSLEMSRYELMAKSISRLSSLEAERGGWPPERKKPARFYLCGKWNNDEEFDAAHKLFDIYAAYAERVHIVEGNSLLNVRGVAGRAKQHIKLTGNKPVVIVDYLQILAPMDPRANDKQNVDRNIVELKRLSRDLKLPVLAVSSFNRDSYTTKASMSAFKESGAIEYTADVLIGLQFQGMDDKFDVDAARKANPREIELLLIKNRHGQCGETYFRYYPQFNLFREHIKPCMPRGETGY